MCYDFEFVLCYQTRKTTQHTSPENFRFCSRSRKIKCCICILYTCPDCLTIIGENKNEEHKCDENSVKSAEMIKKDTRPCPTCGERIFKIEGCDQMFCTAPRKDGSGFCETPFSWKTGKPMGAKNFSWSAALYLDLKLNKN